MKYVTLVLCALWIANSSACEVCGAVTTALGPGTLASGNRHALGMHYQYRNYHSQHPGILNLPDESSYEYFHRWDFTAVLRLAERWQLKAVLPFASNRQEKSDQTNLVSGWGDPTVTAHYFILNRKDTTGFVYRWNVGAGIKLPVGNYAEPSTDWLMLYPGTGSWDGVLQSSFLIQKKQWGILQEISCLLRSGNNYGYKQGNSLSASLYAYRSLNNWTFLAGVQFAANSNDYQDGIRITESPVRGSILSASAGISYRWKNYLAQAFYHVPVYQYLGNGYVRQQTGLNVGVYYLFNQKS